MSPKAKTKPVHSKLRHAVKLALGLEHGGSNPIIERHATTAAKSLEANLPAEQIEQIETGDASILDKEVLLQHYNSPKLPDKRAKPDTVKGYRHWSSVAHENFFKEKRDEFNETVRESFDPEGSGLTASALAKAVRQHAWWKFQALDEPTKKSYLPEDFAWTKKSKPLPAATPDKPQPEDIANPVRATYKLADKRNMEELGKSLVQVVNKATKIKGESLGPAARQLFATCCQVASCNNRLVSSKSLRAKVKNSWNWKSVINKFGKKRGPILSDEQLKDGMKKYTKECSRFSRSINGVMRHLPMSKRRLGLKLRRDGVNISRRQLTRRTQKGKLGISVGYKRSDDCQVMRNTDLTICFDSNGAI